MGGATGTRPSRTLLTQTDEFSRQLSHLVADRSVGHFAGEPVQPPEEFDGRAVWGNLIPPIRDQGMCGSCWAFAATACLSARLAIATLGRHRVNLSPAAMVFCNLGGEFEFTEASRRITEGLPYDYTIPSDTQAQLVREKQQVAEFGCQGETLIGAWQYLFRFGAIEEGCVPYGELANFSGDSGELPACSQVIGTAFDTCPDSGKPLRRHRSSGYYYVPGVEAHPTPADEPAREGQVMNEESMAAVLSAAEGLRDVGPGNESGSEEEIRREIYHWGPVTTGFTIHSDFEAWDGKHGVYKWDGISKETGGHAVVIVGWGNDPAHGPYWIVRNSWGSSWGDGGYFRIARGTNECGIEENVVVGVPDLYGYRLYIEHPLLYREQDLALRSAWRIAPSGHKITTLEKMLDGRLPPYAADVDALIYDSDWWPNLATFIAGEPWRTEYLLQRGLSAALVHPRNYREREVRNRVATGLVAGVVIGGLLVYLLFYKKK